MMDRLVVWTELWRPLLMSRRPNYIYDLPHWSSSGTQNSWKEEPEINILCFLSWIPSSASKRNLYSTAKRERIAERRRRCSFSEQCRDKPAFCVQKKAGSQAVPLLHLTAVQNDSWRLPRRHHGRADVAAAFQVQQHLIPPFALSPLFFFFFCFFFFFFFSALRLILCVPVCPFSSVSL